MITKEMLIQKIENDIQEAHESSPSVERAEQLAGEFLHHQMVVSGLLAKIDLEARMKKSGVKAIRAAIYIQETSGLDKKPTEAMLAAKIDSHEIVQGEQNDLDSAEAERDELKRVFDVCAASHVYFRQLAKGVFGA